MAGVKEAGLSNLDESIRVHVDGELWSRENIVKRVGHHSPPPSLSRGRSCDEGIRSAAGGEQGEGESDGYTDALCCTMQGERCPMRPRTVGIPRIS